MPRLGNVRLSAKLALAFGVVLALTAAIIALDVRDNDRLQAAHKRVTQDVVPRILAAQEAQAAFADVHFAQTQMVLTDGAEREDELNDVKTFDATVATLRRTVARSAAGSGLANVDAAYDSFKTMDAKLFAAVQRGDRRGATQLVAGDADDAADGVISAIEGYIAVANDDRAKSDARFVSLQHEATRMSLGLGAIAFLSALFFVLALGRHVTRRLREVSSAAEAIADGDVDHEISVSGRDEVGRTADALASMGDHLRTLARAADRVAAGDLSVEVEPRSERDRLGAAFAGLVAELRAAVAQMSRTATSVANASQQVAGSSSDAGRAIDEIARALGDVAAGAERQVRSVASAQQTTEQVAGATTASARDAHETSRAATDARGAADAGADTIVRASEAMSAARDASAEAGRAIRELGAKSQRIGGIVDTITAISEQTNLLALNAAIEAARAGEQGRGFAVVADEVRKLAEESQAAASSIAALVAEIRDETERTVAVVEAGAARGETGAATVAEAREAFTRIAASIEVVSERVSQVSSAVDQIAGGAAQVSTDMIEVVTVAEQSSATAQQVSAAAEQTSASTQQIAASAHELSRTARELDELVGRFTL
jgi:methyl-accepting chemotaxis protein